MLPLCKYACAPLAHHIKNRSPIIQPKIKKKRKEKRNIFSLGHRKIKHEKATLFLSLFQHLSFPLFFCHFYKEKRREEKRGDLTPMRPKCHAHRPVWDNRKKLSVVVQPPAVPGARAYQRILAYVWDEQITILPTARASRRPRRPELEKSSGRPAGLILWQVFVRWHQVHLHRPLTWVYDESEPWRNKFVNLYINKASLFRLIARKLRSPTRYRASLSLVQVAPSIAVQSRPFSATWALQIDHRHILTWCINKPLTIEIDPANGRWEGLFSSHYHSLNSEACPTIPSWPKKQLCKRMFQHMDWDHTCSEQCKEMVNGYTCRRFKLSCKCQQLSVYVHTAHPAVSHVAGCKDHFTCTAGQIRTQQATHEDMPTTTRRIASATPAHHQCAGPYHLTINPLTSTLPPYCRIACFRAKKRPQPQQQEYWPGGWSLDVWRWTHCTGWKGHHTTPHMHLCTVLTTE